MPGASNFAFAHELWSGYPADAATKAEHYAKRDPRAACFYARRGLELVLQREHEAWSYDVPAYSMTLTERLNLFRNDLRRSWDHAQNAVRRACNTAVHAEGKVAERQALSAVYGLYCVLAELAQGRAKVPAFNRDLITGTLLDNPSSREDIEALRRELDERERTIATLKRTLAASHHERDRALEERNQHIEQLHEQLHRAPTPEEVDELRAQTQSLSKRLEALRRTEGTSSLRYLHEIGSIPWLGLLVASREVRTEERAQAQAVILEELSRRYHALLAPYLDLHEPS
ncbi:MAG: DUF4145 domain-containing protein [Bacteroidota bacterium]